MKLFRLGMIGCGGIRQQHMSGIRDEVPGLEITAACDIFPDNLKAFCETHRIEAAYASPEEMFSKAELDGVSIAIKPEWDKVSLSIQALEKGLHVLAEKPMALTVKEAEAMAEAARDSGKVLQIGFNRRFEPVYSKAAEFLRDKEQFGEIVSVDICQAGQTNFPYVCLMAQNPHTFDLLQHLAGKVASIQTAVRKETDQELFDSIQDQLGHPSEKEYNQTEPGLVGISAASILKFESGAVGTMRIVNYGPGGRIGQDRLEIIGSRDTALVLENMDTLYLVRAGGREEIVNNTSWCRKVSSYGLEYRHFVEWARGGKPDTISLQDAVDSVYLYEGFIRSLGTEAPIDLVNWEE